MNALQSPGFLSSKSSLGSDISILFALGYITLFLVAGHFARKKKGAMHHRMVLLSLLALAGYLVYYYHVRKMGIKSAIDMAGFSGPDWMRRYAMIPLIYLHVSVVFLSLYSTLYMAINGFKARFPMDGGSRMELRTGAAKPSIVLWTAGMILAAGIIWILSKSGRIDLTHKVFILALCVVIPMAASVAIHLRYPTLDKRHRAVGGACLFIYKLLFVTTSSVYLLIYAFIY